ncbi:MAG: S9 family peptidase [Flavobacteriia bacterium]|nr:MAG: S9 family peptidase [Flavobacteriia bacterium]
MKSKFFTVLAVFMTVVTFAQEKHLTIKDAVLGYYKGLYPERLSGAQWMEDEDLFVYYDQRGMIINNAQGKAVGQVGMQEISAVYPGLPYPPYFTQLTANKGFFSYQNNYYLYDVKNYKPLLSITLDSKAANQEFCMINDALAYTIDNNLYIATADNPKIPVTTIADKNIVSGQTIHRNEFGISKGTFWSPKGNYLAFYQKDETNVSSYPLVDVTTYPAELTEVKYPMAGQGSEQAKIGVFSLNLKLLTYLDIDTSDEHYLTNLAWSPDERYITLAEVNRAQDHYWLNVYDAQTGKKIHTILEEQNERWVEPENPVVFIPGSDSRFLWLSEKDGFMNVYSYDLLKKENRQLTDFDFVVTEIMGFDKDAQHVFVQATGEDPKGLQVYKINIETQEVEKITKKSGTNYALLSPSGKYILNQFTNLTTPNITSIINTETGVEKVLEEAVNPLKDYHLGTTEFVTLKAEDGTALECRQILPADFDPEKKYPVLVYVYGGSHAQLVTDTWLGGSNLWMQYMAAEEDYIVFTMDNRGSDHRGFAFESVCHRNQGVEAMKDQVVGVEYLKSLPYVDTDRIAVHGWSYGGFMTISLLLNYPDLFNAGVAGGPVTDWKYYEVMYGERYMDTPQENPEGYKNTRVHEKITNLKSPLLIIHGSVDDVVVSQHSMTLLKEAVEKEIPIDFFTYPMHKHNVRGKDRVHLMEKVLHYIMEKNK